MKQAAPMFTLLALATTAAQAEPLSIRDLNPLLSGYEIPMALPSTHAGNTSLIAEYSTSNTSLQQHSATESLQLDAELERWQLSFVKPLSNSLSLRIELPYVILSGGHLDNFIEGFHHAFGLPNGNRANWPTRRLYIQHSYLGSNDYQLAQASRGVGDITTRIAWSSKSSDSWHRAIWFSVKLPTGNADTLQGSGAIDVAVSLAMSQTLNSTFTAYQQVSISWLGHGDRLAAQQKSAVWSGTLGMDAAVTSHWSLAAQLDGHTAAFDTDLRSLGNALQLSFGPRYISGAWQTSLSISEDIAVDTAPDVQFQLGVQHKF